MNSPKVIPIFSKKPLSLPDFGRQLKRFIEQSPFTAKEVLEDAGIHPQYLSEWIKDGIGRPPYYYELHCLAKKLNKPVDVLMYGTNGGQEYVYVPKEDYAALRKNLQELKDKYESLL